MDGGLTQQQLIVLFTELHCLEEEEKKFQIQMHGGEVKEDNDKTNTSNKNLQQSTPLFGDPDSYAKYTKEERQIMTDNMMVKHKSTKFL